jgi:hypothetical protein
MRVVIKASDVAAIIGKNKYKPRSEIFDEYWKKYSPETFTGKTRTDKAFEALNASEEAQKILKETASLKPHTSTDVQAVFASAEQAINLDSKLNSEQKAEVIAHLKSRVYTAHGTRAEDRTSDKVVADEGVKLVKDNSFYNLEICELGDVKFVVTGKIDRIEERPDGSRILVEIKNRTNRLFRRVVEYEMVQVQVYLQMLGLIHARLVEQYNNQVLSHDITRDEEMWVNEIIPGIEEFCNEIYSKFS